MQKWRKVARTIDPQNQVPNDRLKRSFAVIVSLTTPPPEGCTSGFMTSLLLVANQSSRPGGIGTARDPGKASLSLSYDAASRGLSGSRDFLPAAEPPLGEA